ncbi:hypothetical protein [Emticicia fontis]
MEPTIVYSDFSTLRAAYIEVKKFASKEVGVKKISLKTTVAKDLGCAGDDNFELLEKFVTKYDLDFIDFDYSKHFLSEGELMRPGLGIVNILLLFFFLITWVIKIITFNKIDFTDFQLLPNLHRKTLDMTFGDMLTWYLTGKYSLRTDVNFKIKSSI